MEVSGMHKHLSRPDVTKSQIKLAFPFNDSNGPLIDEQQIFAFMPLRTTSLPVRMNVFLGLTF
jgi:hypothetical protein